jgi:uncharacterized membrane protein
MRRSYRHFWLVKPASETTMARKSLTTLLRGTPLWIIPMIYVGMSLCFGILFLRFEKEYLSRHAGFFPGWLFDNVAIPSAQAYLSAVASGMLTLTAIVFTVAYITSQFNSVAYSPRVASLFVRDPTLVHTFGLFNATFLFSVITLGWVDRGNSGFVPEFSLLIVVILVILSMFSFARLVRGVSDLQIANTLHKLGDHGRDVLKETFDRLDPNSGQQKTSAPEKDPRSGSITQILRHTGAPRSIAEFDQKALVKLAQRFDALIEIDCTVGDTLVYDTKLLQIRGAVEQIPEEKLWQAIYLTEERTFEQDPKYPIRLLVDVAIKALSPAVNDPTTAVQAIDQIEDLLRRLGRRNLEDVHAKDGEGIVRLIYPTPNWEDFLRLSFDEIRQYGATSVQVMRRLRSALAGVTESLSDETRIAAIARYVQQLDLGISRSPLDPEDRKTASQEDRQGLGFSRVRATLTVISGPT